MAFVGLLRKSNRPEISFRAVILCVAALALLARYVPRSSAIVQLDPNIHSHTNHPHGQFFDHEDPQYTYTLSAAPEMPSPNSWSEAPPAPETFLEIMSDGLHYNRPPPVA
jgi:hypothetical protein